jgi:hypothetical protein
LEREFAKTERATLGQIRDITRTRISLEQRRALDLLAAVHLVRSESFVAVHGQVTDAFFDNWPADYIADSRTRLQELFVADRGRQPEPGELQNLVDALTRKFQASPDLTANGMRHVTAGIPRLLARYRVQLVEAPSWMSGFVLADQPVVHARPDEGRYGFASQLAVGDADLIMVPIKRRGLRVINAALCRNAVKEVACHPDDARDVSNVIRHIDQHPASVLTDGTLK